MCFYLFVYEYISVKKIFLINYLIPKYYVILFLFILFLVVVLVHSFHILLLLLLS